MVKNNLNNRGMSLIEIMVALLILMVAFIGLIQAFPFSRTIVKTAENSTKSSYLAQDELEQLLALSYENIPVGTVEAKQRLSADPTNDLYYFQRQTVVSYVDGNLQASGSDLGLKKITVTVYYSGDLLKNEKTYTTYSLIAHW